MLESTWVSSPTEREKMATEETNALLDQTIAAITTLCPNLFSNEPPTTPAAIITAADRVYEVAHELIALAHRLSELGFVITPFPRGKNLRTKATAPNAKK